MLGSPGPLVITGRFVHDYTATSVIGAFGIKEGDFILTITADWNKMGGEEPSCGNSLRPFPDSQGKVDSCPRRKKTKVWSCVVPRPEGRWGAWLTGMLYSCMR